MKPKKNNEDGMKLIGTVAMMGEVLGGNTLAEKNAWKKRMLVAGLSKKGLSFPDDWDKGVSEADKKKRLDMALKELMK